MSAYVTRQLNVPFIGYIQDIVTSSDNKHLVNPTLMVAMVVGMILTPMKVRNKTRGDTL